MPDQPGDYAMKIKSSWDGTDQPWRFYLPENFGKDDREWPVVVCLHGKGADENAWFDFTTVKEAADKYQAILAAPYGRGNYWYRGAGEQDVLDILNFVSENYPVDKQRVYMMGHSMGGWGTFWISTRNQGVFAAIAPMSGFFVEDLIPSTSNLNPYLIHCANDDIVTVDFSRSAVRRMSELGISHRYQEETQYRHESRMISDNFDRLFPWLFEHRLNESPLTVQHAVRTPAKGKAFWVEVLETDQFPQTATISARYYDSKVHIETTDVTRLQIWLNEAPFKLGEVNELIVNSRVYDLPTADSKLRYIQINLKDRTLKTSVEPVLPTIHNQHLSALEERIEGKSQDEVTLEMAKLLTEIEDVEFCLLREDDFILPHGPVTREFVADFYAYPVEETGIIKMTTGDLKSIIEEFPEKQYVKPQDFFTDPDQEIRILCPVIIAEFHGLAYEMTGERISEKLLRWASMR